jgi:deoxycytidylate deaminase
MKLKFFNLARKASTYSDHPDHQHGAVIVKRNRVISIGYNKYKTSPRSNHPHSHIHSELDAILKANINLSGCSIYIYRENKHGQPAISRPCPSCQALLKSLGITTWHYSDAGGYKEEKVT